MTLVPSAQLHAALGSLSLPQKKKGIFVHPTRPLMLALPSASPHLWA